MSDEVTMSEEEYEHHLNMSMIIGERVGLTKAANELLEASGAAFTSGNDDKAKELRGWSERMSASASRADEKAEAYAQKHSIKHGIYG